MKLGLIGKNIQLSQAPDIHKRLGNLFKIPVSYQIFDLVTKRHMQTRANERQRCPIMQI